MHFDVHFWEGLCFVLFVLITYKPIKRALSNYLDEYARSIEQKVVEAESLHKEAKKTFKYYTEQHKTFTEKIASASRHTEENIHDLKQQSTKKLEEKIIMKQKMQQDKLRLYDRKQTKQLKTAMINKAMMLVSCYLEDISTPNLTRNQITQLLSTTKDKSITFH